jgi:hypothetical protein
MEILQVETGEASHAVSKQDGVDLEDQRQLQIQDY